MAFSEAERTECAVWAAAGPLKAHAGGSSVLSGSCSAHVAAKSQGEAEEAKRSQQGFLMLPLALCSISLTQTRW